MRSLFKFVFSFAFFLFSQSLALASPGNPDNLCRDLPRETSGFQLAQIKGEPNTKVHFIHDYGWGDYNCPDSDQSHCQSQSYVIPGDTVIVSRSYKKWICSSYKNAAGQNTSGWLPLSAVMTLPTPSIAQRELPWFGKWQNGKNWLQIDYAMEGGDIKITGEAFWEGVPGNIHVATIAGFVTPNGRSFQYEDEPPACSLKAYLLEPYLIVADNVQCGGANVSFTGVYKK